MSRSLHTDRDERNSDNMYELYNVTSGRIVSSFDTTIRRQITWSEKTEIRLQDQGCVFFKASNTCDNRF